MKRIYILLIVIAILAAGLRIDRLDSVPPSLSWDETAVGFNAYTIANNLRDEYGTFLPLFFKSFGEDKQPIHIYITALSVKLLGLSEFSTRLPAAIFGILNVVLIFFLARVLFKSDFIGLSSSLFLAISPQNIFFSRFNHEANFALFFFMLGLLLFYQGFKKNRSFSPLSFFFFLLSMVSYHAAEIIVPPVLLLLFILYFKDITWDKASVLLSSFLLGGFIALSIFNPRLLGIVRYNQTIQGKSDFEKTILFKSTNNYFLGRINLILEQYSGHFDPKFLFESGDTNPRLSAQGSGEFYKVDAIFLILGLIYLFHKKSKESLLVFFWALLGPLPSSLFAEAPHAGRAAFMMGSWQIITALGFYTLIDFFKKAFFRRMVGFICLVALAISLKVFLNYYFNEFPKRYAIDWQYGMKQIVEYVKNHKEYDQVYNTAIRSQPYIFYLYYLNKPLSEYLNTVIFNNAQDRSSNNVSYFDRYSFGGWNSVVNESSKGVLYVLSPSEYDGLIYRSNFDVKKVIYYPNGTNAFFIVALK